MLDFGKESAFIVLRNMAQFAIKQADMVLGIDKNIKVEIPDIVRRFCKGEDLLFGTEDKEALVMDPVGKSILAVCVKAQELRIQGGDVKRIIETAKFSMAEALTDISLRENFKGTQVPVELRVSFIQTFNCLLQYKFLVGEDRKKY
jgi:hypothetical protein